MPAYGEAAMEKRDYEARLEELEYWGRAEGLLEHLGVTSVRRLVQLTPLEARRTGQRLSPRIPEAVVGALAEAGVIEDGRRLTFAGKYVMHYLAKQLRGEGLYERTTLAWA